MVHSKMKEFSGMVIKFKFGEMIMSMKAKTLKIQDKDLTFNFNNTMYY